MRYSTGQEVMIGDVIRLNCEYGGIPVGSECTVIAFREDRHCRGESMVDFSYPNRGNKPLGTEYLWRFDFVRRGGDFVWILKNKTNSEQLIIID